jgi:hypothetical protein
MTPEYTASLIEWQGIALSVSYEPNWLGCGYTAHLQIQTAVPEHAPLPVTETGYRSLFLPMGIVEEVGGAEAYVRLWLDEAARSREWKEHQERSRQYSLF